MLDFVDSVVGVMDAFNRAESFVELALLDGAGGRGVTVDGFEGSEERKEMRLGAKRTISPYFSWARWRARWRSPLKAW